MKLTINNETVSEDVHKIDLCNSDMNSDALTERLCESADIQLELYTDAWDIIREYFVTVLNFM